MKVCAVIICPSDNYYFVMIIYSPVIDAVFFSYGRLLGLLDNGGEKTAAIRKIGKYALYSLLIALTVASFIYLKCIDVDSSFIYFQF